MILVCYRLQLYDPPTVLCLFLWIAIETKDVYPVMSIGTYNISVFFEPKIYYLSTSYFYFVENPCLL